MPPEPPTRRVAFIVAATFFMLLLDGAILNTSLPQMAASFGVPPLTLSVSVTVYLLTSAAIVPCSGWLADRYGAKRVFLLSTAAFTLASVACGLSQGLWQLVLARAIQGLAGGVMAPVGRAIVMGNASKAELMDVTALITWPALLAPVLGPPLGGFITTYASWRWNFLLNLPLGLAGLWLLQRWVPADRASAATALDRTGALGSAAGLVLLLSGLELCSHAGTAAGDWGVAAALVIGGLGVLAWTARHLRRTPQPVVSLAPLEIPTFSIATVAAGLPYMMCLQAMPFLLPVMFQVAFGMTPVHAGLLTLAYFAGNLGMKAFTTPILRRFGFRRVMVVDGALAALAIAACALLQPGTPTAWTVLLLVAAGATRSLQLTAINTLSFADIAPAQRHAAATLSSVSMQVASVMGVAVGALLLAVSQSLQGRLLLDHVDFQVALLVLALVAALSSLGFLRLQPHAGSDVSGHKPVGA